MKKFLKKLLPDSTDMFVFSGLGVLAYGIYMIFPPVALVTVGCFLIYLGLWGGK